MYSVIASKNFVLNDDVLTIVEHQSFEYCSTLCMELFQKSSVDFRIVDDSDNRSVVHFIHK